MGVLYCVPIFAKLAFAILYVEASSKVEKGGKGGRGAVFQSFYRVNLTGICILQIGTNDSQVATPTRTVTGEHTVSY